MRDFYVSRFAFDALQINYPVKKLSVFLQPVAVETVDALAAYVGRADQACSLEDVEVPRGEGLAQYQAVRQVEHAEAVLPGKLLQDGKPVDIGHRFQKRLEREGGRSLLSRQYRRNVLVQPCTLLSLRLYTA